jgi:TRAP-type uncharacterized transport system substrate-binding protein
LALAALAVALGTTSAAAEAIPQPIIPPKPVLVTQPPAATPAPVAQAPAPPVRMLVRPVGLGAKGVQGGQTSHGAPMKEQINQWTIGLAAGRIEGAPLRLAAELAQVLDDKDSLRVLPIVTRGIFDNFNDLLYLRGIDLTIVYGDTLEHFKTVEKISRVEHRVAYLANLFPAEMHVLARPEINSIQELAGKTVNFNTPGTAAAFTGPIVFERLGIKVNKRFDPHREVMEEMKKDDKVAAVVFVTSKPIAPIANPNWPQGFKLLPVDYTKELEEYYLPAQLEAADYPKLIPAGQRVSTIAVPTVLAVYNWSTDTDRARRLARLIDYLFERWPNLHKPPYDPKWKDVNLAATVPGWRRYPLMQVKLDQLAAARTQGSQSVANAEAAPKAQPRAQGTRPKGEQDRVMKEFNDWNKKLRTP